MKPILWKHCVGQHRLKEVLESAVAHNTVGHAYLFSGEAGCGKFAAALDLALALLCENQEGPRPCMTCASCQKVLHNSHPDFHVVMPVALEKEHKDSGGDLSEEGWQYISDKVRERIKNVYTRGDHTKAPDIPVEWIGETNHTILRGPLEGDFNVVIIDGVDILRKEPANRMLKVLEEPRAGTLMLLLTNRISAVLPTIVSRCQIMRFSWLSPLEIREYLERSLSPGTADEKRLESVIHTGSLGRSIELWDNPPDNEIVEAQQLWDLCAEGRWPELATLIDNLSAWNDFSKFENLFLEIITRVRNSFLSELPDTENVFLGDRSRTVAFPGPRNLALVEKITGLCQQSIAAVRAHANNSLVLANFAIALSEALRHGEKQ